MYYVGDLDVEGEERSREMSFHHLRGPPVDGDDALDSDQQQERLGRSADTSRYLAWRK